MRQVPLERDINIAVKGCSGFATSTQKGPYVAMLISGSRGTYLIIRTFITCIMHYCNQYFLSSFQPANHPPEQQLHLGDRLADLLGEARAAARRAPGQPHQEGHARRHRRPAAAQIR